MTLPPGYFDERYAADPDPWGFEERWYEKRKYALTLAALPRLHYRRGFEVGCSNGVLTEQLASRCHHLIACDAAIAAVTSARQRLTGREVDVRHLAIPKDWPDGIFDLMILSEVGYYLDPGDMSCLASKVGDSLAADGHLIAVHWRPRVADYPSDAEAVHRTLRNATGLTSLGRYEEDRFILEVFGQPGSMADPESG
ncbi:MAG TPA: SAM-dependent methyltransferase [Acidimicrobiales bacterium]|nr:SAM-dependent methyltransferase [Acidimicrobiales bacterium]